MKNVGVNGLNDKTKWFWMSDKTSKIRGFVKFLVKYLQVHFEILNSITNIIFSYCELALKPTSWVKPIENTLVNKANSFKYNCTYRYL